MNGLCNNLIIDVVKQKSAFQHNWFSNNKGLCLEIKRWKSTMGSTLFSSYCRNLDGTLANTTVTSYADDTYVIVTGLGFEHNW